MHAVALTHAFIRAARQAGMTDGEVDGLVDFLAENPTAGVEIAGTGGCRKMRFAGRGKGKSLRVITKAIAAEYPHKTGASAKKGT